MLSRAFYANEVARYSTEKNLAQGTFYPNFMVMRMYGILDNTSFSTWDDIRSASVMNKGIARYDMAQLMTNIMNSRGFSASSADKNDAISKIADYNKIPSQYKDAVSYVYALGIIGGYSDGTFGGEVTMNRGQAAIVIYRMMQFSGGSSTEAETTTTETPSTPAVSDPVEPETPTTPATLTLRDGSAVTEANALKMIEPIKQVYPTGTAWGYDTYRTDSIEIGGRKLGEVSGAVQKADNTYCVSVTKACGGFASLVSDAIFGGKGTGGENFPIRKLDSVADVRPGDFLVEIGTDGKSSHYLAAASSVKSTATVNGVTLYYVDTYEGNNNEKVVYNDYGTQRISDDLYRNHRYEAWTRYPA